MRLLKNLFFAIFLLAFVNTVRSQCTAPTFTLDLRAKADTTFILKNQTRGGVCCVGSSTLVSSSNCVSFVVYLNPNTELISFDVTSPAPSGSAYYQVNCGTPVSIGTPLCAVGLVSPFTITYCKPGGDSPNYVISAGTIVKGSEDISIQKTGCVDTLFVSNVNTSSIVWTSIYPGNRGDYDSFLSCTTGCNSTLVTPSANPPAYVDFEVSGMPNTSCGSFSRDTVRVYFVPRLTGTVTPASPVICSASGTSVTFTANVSGGALPYKYDWSGDPGPNNAQTSTVSSAGTYTVIITDNTKCPPLTLTKTVASIPATTFTYSPSQLCKNGSNPTPSFIGYGQPGVFSATPAGLSFVSNTTGEVNLSASTAGTYVVTNTISPSGTCPGSSATATITLYNFPTMTSSSTATVCSGATVNIPLTASMGSSYSWVASDNTNVTGESTSTQTTSTLSNVLTNTTTSNQLVVYTVTPTSTLTGACAGTPQTVSVTVRPKDNAGFSYPSSTNCQTGTNPVATITGLAGGTFSAGSGLVFSDAVGTISLSASSIGSYTVTYTTNGPCPNSQTFPINITTAPSAAFGYSASPYCQSSTNPLPTFSVNASGGTFSASGSGLVFTNNLTGEVNLSASTPGTYTITNTIAPSGLCGTSTSTAAITITKLKDASFNYTASPICKTSSNPAPTFTGSAEAGTFSSTSGLSISASTGSINLSGSTAGTYTVTNTIAAVNGCPIVVATNNITITDLPKATFNYSASPFCSTATSPLPTFTGGGVAGLFSPSSVFLNVNSTTGLVDISNSLPGNYIVTNNIAAANGCPAVASTASITITSLPIANLSYAGPYCSNGANPTPTLSAGGSNGIYSSLPSGLIIDANAGTVDLAGSTAGTYTVTNTIAAASGCPQVTASSSLTITKLPIATFNYSATPYCISGTNPSPTFTGGGVAGTFSATPGVSVNPTSGLVTLSGSSAGTYTVTNTITAANGCPAVVENNTITINPIATANAASDATICASGTHTLSGNVGGAATTLTWTSTGTGSFNNANIGNAIYTPSASDISAGSVTLTIRSNDPAGPCSFATDAMILSINPTPTVSAGPTRTLTCANTTVSLSGSGGGTYAWSGPGIVSGATSAAPNVNKPGTYSLVVTSAQNCPSGLSTVTVFQNTTTPTPSANNTTTLTCSINTATLNGNPSSGVSYQWSGPGFSGSTTSQNALATLPGTYTLLVTNTINGCINTAVTSVTQNTTTPVTVASTSGSITCTTNTINLLSSVAGLNYNWTAPSGSSILSGASFQNAIAQGLGTYTLSVIDPINNCTYSTTTSAIQNTTQPTGVSAGSDQVIICGVPSVTLTGSANPTNSSANWLGGVCGSVSDFTTTACAPGTYTLEVAHPITGCVVSSTVAVTSSTDIPQATVNAVTNSITCTNSVVTIGVTLNNSDPVDYLWSGPGVSGSSTSAVTSATTNGTYSVTITNTVTNCQSIYTSVVTIDTIPVVISITPASSITCSSPTQTLQASPVGSEYNYSWNGTSIVSAGNTANPVVDAGGDYNVTITNTINGCSASSTVTVPSNTILPTVLISVPSITTTCSSPSATLNIAPTPSTDVTYLWTAPSTGALDSYTVSSPVATGAGIYTVVVTNTISGCASSVSQNTIEIVEDFVVPTTTLSTTSTSITCSIPTPSVQLNSNFATSSYSWIPTNGIVAGTENTATPSFSLPGTYSVIVTNTVSGCSTSTQMDEVTVVLDNTIPVITITGAVNDGTLTCTTTSIVVSPTITPNSNITYSWTSGSGNGISGPSDQSTATFTAAGTYTLAITNTVTGCVSAQDASSIFTVYENTVAPTVLISAPSVTTTCAEPTATLNIAVTPTTDVIYNWTAPSTGSLSATNISNPIASGSGVFTVVVTNTVSGCVSTSITQSTIEIIPDITIPTTTLSTNSVSITCAVPTPSVNLSSNVGNVTYNWTPVSGIVPGTENTANPAFVAPGTYSAVVTNTISGCATFISNNVVTVVLDNTIPVVNMSSSVNNATITCSTTSISITPTVTPNNNITYTWTSNTGSGISGATNQSSATFTAAGVYSLAITNTVTGCTSLASSASTFTISVDTLAPKSNFNFATSCSNDSVRFTDVSVANSGIITNWNWNFGDGNTSTLQNPANAYASISSYTVSLEVQSSNGCKNTSHAFVNLIPTVVADYNPAGGQYLINQPIAFTNASSGASGYIWNFGDGGTANTTDTNYAFSALGSYSVMLIASNGVGCVDTVTYVFDITPTGGSVPGGFTPNGDGLNDGFSILGGPYSSYDLRVFNAWGNEVYSSTSQDEKWDGSYRGAPQPAGTYIYIFSGKIVGGKDVKLQGEVHLIR